MNESPIPKSAVASTAKDPEIRVPLGVRCVAWFAVLMFVNLPAVVFAQSSSCLGIHVKVLNIRNSTGTVDCAIFDSSDGFPYEALHSAMKAVVMRVRNVQARCDFQDIVPGTYALAVIHDERTIPQRFILPAGRS